jgi:hypothetical protein
MGHGSGKVPYAHFSAWIMICFVYFECWETQRLHIPRKVQSNLPPRNENPMFVWSPTKI